VEPSRIAQRIFQLLILVNAAGNQSAIDRKGGRAFVKDMKAFFAEENPIRRDGIAGREKRSFGFPTLKRCSRK
jgi:hypothetical protein